MRAGITLRNDEALAMSVVPIDTLSTARALEKAGFERHQAEAMQRPGPVDLDALATKADLDTLRINVDSARIALKADIEKGLADLELRLRRDLATKTDITSLRSEMRWMFGFQAALILAIAAKLFGIIAV